MAASPHITHDPFLLELLPAPIDGCGGGWAAGALSAIYLGLAFLQCCSVRVWRVALGAGCYGYGWVRVCGCGLPVRFPDEVQTGDRGQLTDSTRLVPVKS